MYGARAPSFSEQFAALIEGGPAATRVYDRYNYDAEKRDALDRWARGLAAIIEGKTKKVVAFRDDDSGHGAATAKIDVRCR